jgi:uracil-DNA glycosylase
MTAGFRSGLDGEMTTDEIRSIPGRWGEAIARRLKEKDRLELEAFLANAWNAEVYPWRDQVFAAFEATHLNSVRAVILGQDPYPNAGQACGLAFSVPKGMLIPPSLRKILKTARDDMGIHLAPDATLDSWTRHGVLLLNTALTVPAKDPGGHRTVWKPFTKAVLEVLAERKESISFFLWGAAAKKWASVVDLGPNVVMAPHPASRFSPEKPRSFESSHPFGERADRRLWELWEIG